VEVSQHLKLAGLLQAIRVRFAVILRVRERVGCQTNCLFDPKKLGWRVVAGNQVFIGFAVQEFPDSAFG
jgi:hypothetical protein